MNWYVYDLAPIDFGWHMLPTAKQFLHQLIDGTNQALDAHEPNGGVEAFMSAFNYALGAAGGLEVLREEPRVMVIPSVSEYFIYGFVIKMDRGGATHVVSPVEMPWLGNAR